MWSLAALARVFNLSDKRGFLDTIRDYVVQQGATHLDTYASKNQNLQEIYGSVGN